MHSAGCCALRRAERPVRPRAPRQTGGGRRARQMWAARLQRVQPEQRDRAARAAGHQEAPARRHGQRGQALSAFRGHQRRAVGAEHVQAEVRRARGRQQPRARRQREQRRAAAARQPQRAQVPAASGPGRGLGGARPEWACRSPRKFNKLTYASALRHVCARHRWRRDLTRLRLHACQHAEGPRSTAAPDASLHAGRARASAGPRASRCPGPCRSRRLRLCQEPLRVGADLCPCSSTP